MSKPSMIAGGNAAHHPCPPARRLAQAMLLAALACGGARAGDPGTAVSPMMAARGAPQAAQAAEPDAATRLEALRHALADEALKGPVRVQAAAWIDESGQLRESLQIRSDMKLRGVRVLSYLGEPEALTARVEAEPAPEHTPAEASGQTPPACRASEARLKRHLLLMPAQVSGGAANLALLNELAVRIRGALLQGFGSMDGWVLTAGATSRSPYEAALAGRDAPTQAPYALQVFVQSAATPASGTPGAMAGWLPKMGAADHAYRMPGHKVQLAVRMVDSITGRLLWSRQAEIEFPPAPVSYTHPRWPARVEPMLQELLADWQPSLMASTACEPLRFGVQPGIASDQLVVQAGARVGLRAGDQLMLVDRARFPGRVLEAGVLDQAALVEIISTAQDEARARRVSGPPVTDTRHLMAMPL